METLVNSNEASNYRCSDLDEEVSREVDEGISEQEVYTNAY
jgi:hypothetical protein